MNRAPFTQLPIVARGPGSQSEERELEYLHMPRGMNAYRAPVLPEPEIIMPLTAALDVLHSLRIALRAAASGEPPAPIALAGLPDADRALLGQVLGEGEVSAVVRAPDAAQARLQVQEAVFAGVWRVLELLDDGAVSDRLEVGALPEALLAQAERDGARLGGELDEQASAWPEGVMNAPALLAELREHWRGDASGREPHVLNLTLLPLSAADVVCLDAALGSGAVTILSRGYGNCRIVSTERPATWRVVYYNSEDTVILNTVEVSRVPEVACAAPQDLADSDARLGELLAWIEGA